MAIRTLLWRGLDAPDGFVIRRQDYLERVG
jgi:hypothetical protein